MADGLMTLTERSIGSLEDPSTPISEGLTLLEALGGKRTATGKAVNAHTAPSHTAVYAAIQIIASTVSSLPLKLYRREDGGGKVEQRNHPAWRTVSEEPNDRMSAVSFFDAAQGHLLTRGNAYAAIENNGRGQTDGLLLLPPDNIRVEETRTGQPVYVMRLEGSTSVFMPEEILHVKGLGGDGKKGWSPIRRAREAIGQGLAIEEYNARFFGNNAVPQGFLQVPGGMDSQKQKQFSEEWHKAHGGLDQQHKTAVLTGEVVYQQTGLTAEDAQVIESLKLNWRQVAQVFNVPPHKIRDLEDATFSNIEAQNIEFVQDTIRPWLVRWEQEMNRKLLTDRERGRGLFFEFNVDGLLRGDSERRAQMIKTRFNTGSWSPNDIRAMENEDPIEGGDQYFMPLNMIPISQAQDLSPDQRAKLLHAAHGGEVEAREGAIEGETRQQTPERVGLRDIHRPSLLDAAERVVRGEIRDLRRMAERLLPDNRDAFLTVLGDYYFGRDEELEDLPFGLRGLPAFFRDTYRPAATSYIQAVARSVAEELDEDPDELIDADEVRENLLAPMADKHARRSRTQIEQLVEEAEDGERAAERMDTRLGEWREGTDTGRPRPERMADEQTVGMGEAVAKAGFAAAAVLTLRWQSIGTSCPYCRQMDGAVVGVRENFAEAGQTVSGDGTEQPLAIKNSGVGHPPLHRGCDCIVVPGG